MTSFNAIKNTRQWVSARHQPPSLRDLFIITRLPCFKDIETFTDGNQEDQADVIRDFCERAFTRYPDRSMTFARLHVSRGGTIENLPTTRLAALKWLYLFGRERAKVTSYLTRKASRYTRGKPLPFFKAKRNTLLGSRVGCGLRLIAFKDLRARKEAPLPEDRVKDLETSIKKETRNLETQKDFGGGSGFLLSIEDTLLSFCREYVEKELKYTQTFSDKGFTTFFRIVLKDSCEERIAENENGTEVLPDDFMGRVENTKALTKERLEDILSRQRSLPGASVATTNNSFRGSSTPSLDYQPWFTERKKNQAVVVSVCFSRVYRTSDSEGKGELKPIENSCEKYHYLKHMGFEIIKGLEAPYPNSAHSPHNWILPMVLRSEKDIKTNGS